MRPLPPSTTELAAFFFPPSLFFFLATGPPRSIIRFPPSSRSQRSRRLFFLFAVKKQIVNVTLPHHLLPPFSSRSRAGTRLYFLLFDRRSAVIPSLFHSQTMESLFFFFSPLFFLYFVHFPPSACPKGAYPPLFFRTKIARRCPVFHAAKRLPRDLVPFPLTWKVAWSISLPPPFPP